MARHDDTTELLAAAEAARLRARDRKRTTRMVVDNAGVKKLQLARRDRAARQRATGAGPAREGAAPG